MSNKLWIQWRCEKCNRSHKFYVNGGHIQANDRQYSIDVKCDKCRKKSEIWFNMSVRTLIWT